MMSRGLGAGRSQTVIFYGLSQSIDGGKILAGVLVIDAIRKEVGKSVGGTLKLMWG